jgi:hypothetical protein
MEALMNAKRTVVVALAMALLGVTTERASAAVIMAFDKEIDVVHLNEVFDVNVVLDATDFTEYHAEVFFNSTVFELLSVVEVTPLSDPSNFDWNVIPGGIHVAAGPAPQLSVDDTLFSMIFQAKNVTGDCEPLCADLASIELFGTVLNNGETLEGFTHDVTIQFVPEPPVFMLLMLGAAAVSGRLFARLRKV